MLRYRYAISLGGRLASMPPFKDSIKRAKQKLHKYIKERLTKQLKMFIGSWNGHIQWADCYNLKLKLGIKK